MTNNNSTTAYCPWQMDQLSMNTKIQSKLFLAQTFDWRLLKLKYLSVKGCFQGFISEIPARELTTLRLRQMEA